MKCARDYLLESNRRDQDATMSTSEQTIVQRSSASVSSLGRALVRFLPALLVVAGLVGLVFVSKRSGWKVPKFSTLAAHEAKDNDDWCSEHSVPESACVECHPELMPKAKEYGWCRIHGVHECPTCNPQVAQLSSRPQITAAERSRVEEVLAFTARPGNGRTCRQQQRRLQFASEEVFQKLE